ncbi:MAG TPA: PAS domain S-box protein [Myxococcota bacterium]|nr:PAS domain S-box protein [Myxococcota bacterium]HRY97268.1 PAS domain S-box protein [Myxococcota bacterium]
MKTEPLIVLAVDDDPDYLRLLRAGLREALPEAELAMATDGLQGLALARDLDPDVVLLDLVMPGIDGYEVCRRLKAEDRLRDIPVLVLSAAQADRTSRLAALAAGAEAFLSKPCEEPELVAQIRAMAKIKAANQLRQLETAQLEAMVAQRTRELTQELNERRHIEEKLRLAHERLRGFVDANIVGVVIASPTGEILEANDYYLRLLGYTREELERGQVDWRALTPPEWLPADERAIDELRERGTCTPYEKEYLRRDGTRVPVFLADAMLPDSGEQIAAFALDLTDKKKAEDALRKLSARHEAILLEIPDILMEVDADKVYTWANPAGLEFFGPDVLGQEAARYFVRKQDTYAKVRSLFNGDAATFYVESWQRRKDGQERLLGWWCRALKDADGQVVGALSTARDLTDARRDEEALRESEDRFRQVFEAANVGKSMTLPGGEVHVNKAFADMLGYSLEELRGKTWQALTPAEDVPATRQVIDELLSGRRDSARFTKRYLRKDSSPLWADVSVALRRDAAGQPLHFITTVVDISERVRTERALQESERKLGEAKRMAGLGHWFWDIKTGAVEWSEEVYRIFRLDPGTFRPHIDSIQALSPWPGDHERDQELIRRATENREKGTYEQRFLRPDGSIGHYQSTFQGHYDPSGELVAIVGTVMDITERKQAELALQESERQLHLIAGNARDMIWLMDLGFRITWISPSVTRLRGYTLEELAGLSLEQQLTPRSLVGALELSAAELTSDRLADPGADITVNVELEFPRKDGSAFWAESVITLLRDEAGMPTGFLGVGRDISDRKRAQAALAVERDNLRAFLDAAPAAILVLDEREEVRNANPAAERLFDRSLSGADRRHCGDFIGCAHRGDDPRGCGEGPTCPECQLYGVVREALAGHGVRDRELTAEIVTGVGSMPRRLVCNAAPITLSGKRGAILALHDITELRRAEQERERLQASLAQADRLSSMGMLAAGVAHEINNPLSYVLYNLESLAADLPGLTEGMRRCHAELTACAGAEAVARALGAGQEIFSPAALEDTLDRLREAVSGAQRIKHIARSLGTFSRVEQPEVKPVDVKESVEHALTMASNEIKYRARVVRDFADVPPVLATEGKLAQVFLNLFINAAHAIPEGRVEQNEIRVRTWAEDGQVCVEVRDTGRGIAPEHQAKIFEPFFTTKGVGAGSGLGLSICKSLVTSFGGEILFTSELGKGTRFTIKLPRLPGDWETGGAEASEQAPSRPGVRGRILVVDDEVGIRASLNRLLGREHEVVTASSGEEAQALLTTDRRFDLVFCDLMMPRMSGMELHAWLTEQDPALAGQVVFITGGAFTPGAAEYLARVGNLRVEKPFDNVSLRRMAGELVLAARAKRK